MPTAFFINQVVDHQLPKLMWRKISQRGDNILPERGHGGAAAPHEGKSTE